MELTKRLTILILLLQFCEQQRLQIGGVRSAPRILNPNRLSRTQSVVSPIEEPYTLLIPNGHEVFTIADHTNLRYVLPIEYFLIAKCELILIVVAEEQTVSTSKQEFICVLGRHYAVDVSIEQFGFSLFC